MTTLVCLTKHHRRFLLLNICIRSRIWNWWICFFIFNLLWCFLLKYTISKRLTMIGFAHCFWNFIFTSRNINGRWCIRWLWSNGLAHIFITRWHNIRWQLLNFYLINGLKIIPLNVFVQNALPHLAKYLIVLLFVVLSTVTHQILIWIINSLEFDLNDSAQIVEAVFK